MPDHDYCQLVLAHHHTVARLEEAMDTVKKNNDKQIEAIGELKEDTLENRAGINAISDKLDNGINTLLNKLNDDVSNMIRANGIDRRDRAEERAEDKKGRSEERAEERIERKEERAESRTEGLDDETIKILKENSWVVSILGWSVRKVIGWVFFIIIFAILTIAFVNNAFWAYGKVNYFKEYPGQIHQFVTNSMTVQDST